MKLARVAALLLLAAAWACSGSSSTDVPPAGAAPGDPNATPPAEGTTPPGTPPTPPGTHPPPPPPASDGGTGSGGSTAILGTLTGSCGQIAALLSSPTPSLLHDDIVFVAGETYDRASLSPDGQRMYDTANAGGSSTESEVMSFEDLHFCEGASLLHTETEIAYAPPDDSGANSITDSEVLIGGQKVGVSVTRAYKPSSQVLTDADVKLLIEKKLVGINRSSERVLPADKWVKQILHVFAATQDAADAIDRVWGSIDAATKADTIVLVTHTKGGGFIYCNPDPPLGSECP